MPPPTEDVPPKRFLRDTWTGAALGGALLGALVAAVVVFVMDGGLPDGELLAATAGAGLVAGLAGEAACRTFLPARPEVEQGGRPVAGAFVGVAAGFIAGGAVGAALSVLFPPHPDSIVKFGWQFGAVILGIVGGIAGGIRGLERGLEPI